ncbi:MAG: alpha-L-fucosidase [Planctomycetota bacterium]
MTRSRAHVAHALSVGALLMGLLIESLARGAEPGDPDKDARLGWWREARFGLFIHWGLYAIPAGEWKGETDHGEWIMTTGQIPVEQYEQFKARFNPVAFDANAWVRTAKHAGIRYIVITTKHHDGFCLFDSGYTDYDVMATPFRRDIMKELSAACRREGLRMCWYHSIMDWHHPDYVPRRGWQTRSAEGADFDRYVAYLRSQVTELLTRYGPIGVMWFDGEWEANWNTEVVDMVGLADSSAERVGRRLRGYYFAARDDVYRFTLVSDDGSRLTIADQLVVDNDGLHGTEAKQGVVPLARGYHPVVIEWFNKTGGAELELLCGGTDEVLRPVGSQMLFHQP